MIATFVEVTTGVTERLFTRIDVTEEWPFVADARRRGQTSARAGTIRGQFDPRHCVLTAMRQSASAELALSSIFRQEAATAVEYSYDARPHEHGVMVRGGAGLPAQVKSLAASLPFAGDWISVLARLIQAIDPDAYLLRTDWSSSRITAVTAYCRFPAEPDDAGLAAVTSHAWPLIWQGPAAGHVARILVFAGRVDWAWA